MAKRMLIDASHPEETRVVVLNGNRLEEFDYESTERSQLKGNIYLAKVTRVEPSLQAAFVEYGGNRHGFLPFSEIHYDYYRIPIADREALLAEQARLDEEAAGDEPNGDFVSEPEEDLAEAESVDTDLAEPPEEAAATDDGAEVEAKGKVQEVEVERGVDTVGGDDVEENARKRATRLLRRYKIQEVIKRRQVMLVQVSKEERGTKGAALTTYLSLAGRYCVLMPNTARGGGISRKIASAADRRRLKKVVSELDIPDGMAVIVRTAGSERSKVEIKRDYEYLMRLWSQIRETTLQSTAPALIHEEANLIKRAIRDLYSRDMDEILVEGEEGYKNAKDFMKNLMPSHARHVKQYKDPSVPLFYHHKVEAQLDAMHSSSVQLRSGGYIVINPTEALVAIDVNSGKATRERHIEETALKTNNEAADEIARQLRLRDLAGLIVIDFIDMEESRHNREVERRFKDAMRHDRARIQFGRISPFGLLEMSRQRLRPSLFETSTVPCDRCGATGFLRSTDSAALHILRVLEEEGLRRGGGEVTVALPGDVALYLLNERRPRLIEVEARHDLRIRVVRNDDLIPPDYDLERLSTTGQGALPARDEAEETAEDGEGRRRRGRRRRRRKDEETEPLAARAPEPEEATQPQEMLGDAAPAELPSGEDADERRKPRRRRGKRGGRRRSKRRLEADVAEDATGSELKEAIPQPTEPSGSLPDEPLPVAQPETATPSEVPHFGEEQEAGPAADKARKPRRRQRKPAAEVIDTMEAKGPDDAAAVAEAVTEPPKRRRAPAKPKAKPEGTGPRVKASGRRPRKPAAGIGDGPSEPAEQPGAGNGEHLGEAAERPAEPAPQPLAASNLEQPDTSADADRPKRRGWWQRWV